MKKTKKNERRKSPVKQKLDRSSLDRLAKIFTAFSDTTRLVLLQELTRGPKNVNELIDAAGTTQANVSRQLKILHQAGLLSREQSGLFVIYSIADSMVLEMCNVACRKLNQATTSTPVPEFFI
jgi:DNA-binding transcriptional ArsR family regulator